MKLTPIKETINFQLLIIKNYIAQQLSVFYTKYIDLLNKCDRVNQLRTAWFTFEARLISQGTYVA